MMRRIETHSNEQNVLDRIEKLKAEGIREEEMTVISRDGLRGTSADYGNVTHSTTEGSTLDKIVSWLADEDPEDLMLNEMRLNNRVRGGYRESLEAGKLLLYINQDGKYAQRNKRPAGRDEGAAAGRRRRQGNLSSRLREDPADTYGYEEPNAPKKSKVITGTDDEETIRLREERLAVDKEKVNIGEVEVSKHVDTELQEFDVPVDRDHVNIERRAVEGSPTLEAYSHDDTDDEEGVMRIPLTEERIRIVKETVVTEEVIIRKEKIRNTEHFSEEVRREDIDITERENDPDRFDDRRR